MKAKSLKWTFIAVTALGLTGCANPIKTVQSDNLNTSYDQPYWTELASDNPQTYNEAIDYCQHNTTKPNCGPVINTWFKLGYMKVSNS